MRRLFLAGACLLLLSSLACSGDSDSAESEASPTAAAAGSTPTIAQLIELTKLAVPGYSASEAGPNLVGASVTYVSDRTTGGGANILVRVSLVACDPFICGSLDPAEYSTPDAQRNVKSILPTGHVENPSLRWEFGSFKLSPTATGLAYYALSYLESKNADGSTTRSSANSFRAWYHNGKALVAMDVFGRSPMSVLSAEDLAKRMPKADAEQAVREVFAVFEPNLPK